MARSAKKRHQQYHIVGIRFSNGKNMVEIGKDISYKRIRNYLPTPEVWAAVEHIADNLFSVKDISLENGSKSIQFKVEDVVFDQQEREDQDGQETV